MNGSAAPVVPPWDREGDLDQARAQAANRVAEHVDAGRVALWLDAERSPEQQLNEITTVGPKPVVGSHLVLWAWPPTSLCELSVTIEAVNGVLVFVEPTAGLGLRRMVQTLGRGLFGRTRRHNYQSDIPAELRTAGFSVTTQVRLRHGWAGDYVRGEARHFGDESPPVRRPV